MIDHEKGFLLPGKIDSLLATLNRLYERSGETLLRRILVNGKVSIHEEWDYDNWDGGIYGHAVTLTVPEQLFLEIMDEKETYQERISLDLNKVNNIRQEHVSAVFVEMEASDDRKWREESGLCLDQTSTFTTPPDALERIWGPQHVRIFVSHKANIKIHASQIKDSFLRCGISAFVAHEDIEPTQEWQREIEHALRSMDALLALLTPDFHESDWTDQEVGVAMGRGVPLIAVRLGRDPYGLMGKGQGLGGCSLSKSEELVLKVLDVLHKRMSEKSRLFECALAAYASSVSFADSAWKVENLLNRFEGLTTEQVDRVIRAYRSNGQNRDSFRGKNLLRPLLEKWTGKGWQVFENELRPVSNEVKVASADF